MFRLACELQPACGRAAPNRALVFDWNVVQSAVRPNLKLDTVTPPKNPLL
jgi:hypothetical protein